MKLVPIYIVRGTLEMSRPTVPGSERLLIQTDSKDRMCLCHGFLQAEAAHAMGQRLPTKYRLLDNMKVDLVE